MHQCLQIPEILILIFELVASELRSHKATFDRQSILALVKTCRPFRGPALQLLWRTLYSPVPLLLTMPDDLWEVETVERPDHSFYQPRTLTFKREVIPSDWQRFDTYAPLVKQLGITDRHERSPISFLVIDDAICCALEQRKRVLLPNLKTIVASSNDLPYTSLFLTPQVYHLRLMMLPTQLAPLSCLAVEIPYRAPNLKTLHLSQSSAWKPAQKALFTHALSELLAGLDLEEFHCDWFPLSDEMSTTLFSMPSVRGMTVRKEVAALARILEEHPIPGPEPQMQAFILWSDALSPSLLVQLLSLLRPSKLSLFRVTSVSGSCTKDELRDLILTISKLCSPAHFIDFALESSMRNIIFEDTISTAVVDYAMLKPLFPFSNLKQLSLSVHPFDLADAEVKEMAMSWPRLEILCYETARGSPEPRTTMRGLLWLAIYCRHLESLTFNFTGTCQFTPEELSLAANHNLAFLSVGYSIINDPEEVSNFFNSTFSNLSLLMWNEGTIDSPNSGRWREVEAQIQRPMTFRV